MDIPVDEMGARKINSELKLILGFVLAGLALLWFFLGTLPDWIDKVLGVFSDSP